MPSLHLVPMFFSTWLRRRRTCLAETIDNDDHHVHSEDQLQLLSNTTTAKNKTYRGTVHHHLEKFSVTEEDNDEDEEYNDDLEDDSDSLDYYRYKPYPSPTTTLTSKSTSATTPIARSPHQTKKRKKKTRWSASAIVCHTYRRYQANNNDDDDDSLLLEVQHHQQQQQHANDESGQESSLRSSSASLSSSSVSSSRPLEQMNIIPFISLQLLNDLNVNNKNRQPCDDDDDDDANSLSSNIEVDNALQRVKDANDAEEAYTAPTTEDRGRVQPVLSDEPSASSPSRPSRLLPLPNVRIAPSASADDSPTKSPASPSRPRSRSHPQVSSSPLQGSIGSGVGGHNIPAEICIRISVSPPTTPDDPGKSPEPAAGINDNVGTFLWDPARPLFSTGHDWELHALDSLEHDVGFALACQRLQSLLQSATEDDSADDPHPEQQLVQMLQQYPDLALVRCRIDDCHQYPLHVCCRRGWMQAVQASYAVAPEVIGFAVTSSSPPPLSSSVQDHPVPLQQHVLLPLHGALAHQPSSRAIPIVEFLCQRYPAALKFTNSLHQTPLHLAVLSKADANVVRCLLEGYPTAAQLSDSHGWTPTHYACQQSGRGDILRLLLQDSPCVACTITSRLEKPLHVAAQHNAGDLIRILLEDQYNSKQHTNNNSVVGHNQQLLDGDSTTNATTTPTPTTSNEANNNNVTSHPASNRTSPPPSPPPRTCRRISASLSAASCADSHWCTPLHYLALHGNAMDAQVLQLLVQAYPDAKYAINDKDCTPYEVAVQAQACPELLAWLR